MEYACRQPGHVVHSDPDAQISLHSALTILQHDIGVQCLLLLRCCLKDVDQSELVAVRLHLEQRRLLPPANLNITLQQISRDNEMLDIILLLTSVPSSSGLKRSSS